METSLQYADNSNSISQAFKQFLSLKALDKIKLLKNIMIVSIKAAFAIFAVILRAIFIDRLYKTGLTLLLFFPLVLYFNILSKIKTDGVEMEASPFIYSMQ